MSRCVAATAPPPSRKPLLAPHHTTTSKTSFSPPQSFCQPPKSGRLLYIGDREANWLCVLNANAYDEECNVECVALEAPPKQGSLERGNGWRGGEPPFTVCYIGGGGEDFLNLSHGDAFDQPL